ncbi:hypothetical protein GALL_545760 [mine drainage metagenome]|uniref:Uncharacterized protein n=1 Tax=mine drainage metagenome TaxID=410659 RepID=A0A1J5P017_9ZZZZ
MPNPPVKRPPPSRLKLEIRPGKLRQRISRPTSHWIKCWLPCCAPTRMPSSTTMSTGSRPVPLSACPARSKPVLPRPSRPAKPSLRKVRISTASAANLPVISSRPESMVPRAPSAAKSRPRLKIKNRRPPPLTNSPCPKGLSRVNRAKSSSPRLAISKRPQHAVPNWPKISLT